METGDTSAMVVSMEGTNFSPAAASIFLNSTIPGCIISTTNISKIHRIQYYDTTHIYPKVARGGAVRGEGGGGRRERSIKYDTFRS